MSTTSTAARRLTMTALFVCLAGLISFLLVAPTSADAQEVTPVTLTFEVSEADADTELRSVAIAMDPGTTNLSALTVAVDYDVDKIQVISCATSEAGACNNNETDVKFSVFSLRGLAANEQLLTFDFLALDGASGSSTFSIQVITAVTGLQNTPVDVAASSIDYVVGPEAVVETGSLTGDIIEADSATGLFGLQVCASNNDTQAASCSATNGWGAWRIDDLAAGDYTVSIADPNGVYQAALLDASVSADEITTGLDATLDLIVVESATQEPVVAPTPEPAPAEPTEPVTQEPATQEPATQEPPAEPIDAAAVAAAAAQAAADAETRANASQVDAKDSIYEASISGSVLDRASRQPLVGAQVCATQPLVLTQSCASVAVDGSYELTGLTTGNYWITVVDPLAQHLDSAPKLVGVVGDKAHRTNVNISMVSV